MTLEQRISESEGKNNVNIEVNRPNSFALTIFQFNGIILIISLIPTGSLCKKTS